MSIGLYIETILEFLHVGCSLELMCPAELPEYFNYQSFAYEMMSINRQQLIQLLIGGKEYMRFVNFDKLSDSADYFRMKRILMTEVQKLIIDEFEYARAMYNITQGMFFLTYALLKFGVINDPWKQYDDNEYTADTREMNYD